MPEPSPEGSLTEPQARVLRALWDLHTRQPTPNALRPGLYAAAASLVRRGWVRRETAGRARPRYFLTSSGLPAALQAWSELYPERVEEVRRQMNLPPAP